MEEYDFKNQMLRKSVTTYEGKSGLSQKLTLPRNQQLGTSGESEDESEEAYAEEKNDKILPLKEQPRSSLTKS